MFNCKSHFKERVSGRENIWCLVWYSVALFRYRARFDVFGDLVW